MRKVSQFKKQDPGFADLLNYAAIVDDGVVALKSGAFLAAWSYRGDDLASSSAGELSSVRVRVNTALARLGTGWMMHVDGVRVPAESYPSPDESEFPNEVTALIDSERRSQYEGEGAHFESQYVLSVTYIPPSAVESKLSPYLYEETQGKEAQEKDSEQAAAREGQRASSRSQRAGSLQAATDGARGFLKLHG